MYFNYYRLDVHFETSAAAFTSKTPSYMIVQRLQNYCATPTFFKITEGQTAKNIINRRDRGSRTAILLNGRLTTTFDSVVKKTTTV